MRCKRAIITSIITYLNKKKNLLFIMNIFSSYLKSVNLEDRLSSRDKEFNSTVVLSAHLLLLQNTPPLVVVHMSYLLQLRLLL